MSTVCNKVPVLTKNDDKKTTAKQTRFIYLFYLFIYLFIYLFRNFHPAREKKRYKDNVKLDEGLANGLVVPAWLAPNKILLGKQSNNSTSAGRCCPF